VKRYIIATQCHIHNVKAKDIVNSDILRVFNNEQMKFALHVSKVINSKNKKRRNSKYIRIKGNMMTNKTMIHNPTVSQRYRIICDAICSRRKILRELKAVDLNDFHQKVYWY
jgi:hypothetical protein